MKTRVLILCTGNSCRSQMAEGFLRAQGGTEYEVYSAGIAPSQVNPMAIQVMREAGVDISGHRSKSVQEFLGQHFSYVITVCGNAAKECPIFPGPTIRLHWPFDDPAEVEGSAEERLAVFRRVRDEIAEQIRRWLNARAAKSLT